MRCAPPHLAPILSLCIATLWACDPPEEAQKEAYISGAGLSLKGQAQPKGDTHNPKASMPSKGDELGANPEPPPQAEGDDPAPGIPQEPAPGSDPLAPGIPEEPAPGDPGVPPPPVPGGDPNPQGPMITLTGQLKFDGYTGGLLQLDVMDGPSQGPTGRQPGVVRLERLDKPGAFTIQLPANAGDVYLTAFNDADENGRPNREDPRAVYENNPITVGTDDIKGVVLTLEFETLPPPPGQL